jgi:hypothetical protein
MKKVFKNSQLLEFEEDRLPKFRRIAVLGDIHGNYNIFSSIFKILDPSKDGIIFLGDYGDRGTKGIKVIDTIDSLIRKYPLNIIALKGNHEDYSNFGDPNFYPCDLMYEVEKTGKSWLEYFKNKLKPFIENLYLAAIIPNEVLFVHGGISTRINDLNALRTPTREVEIDVLWSDPFEDKGEYPNRRGAGVQFGNDITSKVCFSLGVKRIFRSHEPIKALEGPYYEHENRIITVSSTSAYGGKPFVIIFNSKEPSKFIKRFL